MRFVMPFCILLAALFIASCSKQDHLLFQERNMIDSARRAGVETLESYKIQPQDILQIRNLQDINYIVGGSGVTSTGGSSQNYQVEEDSTVALPVIGRIPIVGLTRMQAQKRIEGLYRKTLLKDPIIELKIINLQVIMLGEIKSQGIFPLIKDKTTLVEMIGQAGGITENANEKNIEIIRGTQDNPQVTIVDLSNIRSISDPSTILHNGDIVYVRKNRQAIRNDKVTTFSSLLQPGLIVINTILIIFALAKR